MRRVSTDMPNADMQFHLRRQEQRLNDIQNKIAGQTRIKELRDDPLAASHAVRYESYLTRLERFEKNALYANDHYRVTEGYLQQAEGILQRIRELSVTGANGIYAPEDMKNMAVEINELLKELVEISNATGPDGNRLFSGDKAFTEPFRLVEGTVAGGGESMVVRVEYRGAGADRKAEISENAYSVLDIGGGEAFWAEKMQIFSSFDATDYRVTSPGGFFVDGQEITVNPGDTIQAIVAKINDSPAPVKAYVDPETKGLALEGTTAHLIRMEDKVGSTVLQDLGVVAFNSDSNAPNWHSAARVSGGSAFDMVIRLRDALFRGDSEYVGSQGIGGMDLALGNMQSRLAEIGSRSERVETTWRRINAEIPNVTAALSREAGLDFAEAATDLGMMEFAHRAALQTAAKVIQPTLLDFLR
ncbi:flagellar hook-associated protein 3 [Breznakiella homolactica]|uniref:Flagellar hook-associated protein 3 n=1 Tax=Breznakiella homolactica TaxID=2798577 RepID=A0A7T7XJR3_9SPIR|nr:flagellar hook-associated protein 3 [Breznakiella homolactica]QQO07523.1 flagellar hook-associated protein 3 [Breznakiella homolactica]